MANQYVRLNLASAIFPFSVEGAGRSIIMPQADENFDRYNAANTTPDKGVPQVFYMHNVVPIANGYQSIGWVQQLAGLATHTDFDTCFPLFSSNGSNFLFVPGQGSNYIYDGNVGSWTSVSPLASGSVPAGVLVTTAYIQGITYIYYSGIGCFTYDSTNRVLTPVTLTGLTESEVLGITAANGYMIAWTTTTVAWSSLTTPTSFTPSIDTGAGGGSVQAAKGNINFCVPISGGFLIYCQQNIVGAQYTANTAFPYIITEITGSGGVATIDQVGYQTNLPYQVAMTTAGIQQVSLQSAIPTMPEVSDFLTSQLYEDFDETSLSISYTYLSSQLGIKIATVSDRYVVISYGEQAPNFTRAIIYDIGLNRYGILKLPHRSCFSFVNPAPNGLIAYNELMNTPIASLGQTTYQDFFTTIQLAVTPKENLAFMQEDGTVQLVDFEVSEVNADGVFIIGKFQNQRNQVFVHQRTDVETVSSASSFKMYLLPTFDGKDFGAAVPTTEILTGSLTRRLAKRYTASNISLCLVGAFNLSSIVMNFTVGGSR